MELYFSDLLTTDQTELLNTALAIAYHVALQSPSAAAKAFLVEYDHAIHEEEIFQQIDITCGQARAARILPGVCTCDHLTTEGA